MEYEPGPSVFLLGSVYSAFTAHGGGVGEQVDNTISVIRITRNAQGNLMSPRMGTSAGLYQGRPWTGYRR